MVFNSGIFFLFFALVFPLYWILSRHVTVVWRNIFLIATSYLFYGWWDYRFLGLIVFSSVADFLIARKIAGSMDQQSAKRFLVLSIVLNIGLLSVFKYLGFFADSLQSLLGQFGYSLGSLETEIILPVGISFYTFQSLGYVIDVYRKKLPVCKQLPAFLAYVAFFPQLVAGPIARAEQFLHQFYVPKQFNYKQVVSGFRLLLLGLFKKLVFADNLGSMVDSYFSGLPPYDAVGVLVVSLVFGLQIYMDFSGYSDMAIGLARSLGFELPANFKAPYLARSFKEFWQRWHISLSSWFRDYVYIPLGGNRGGSVRNFFTLLLTFLLSGLWHGAHAKFLLWGGLHGLALATERRLKRKASPWSVVLVFLVTTLLWLPFRAESWLQLRSMGAAVLHSQWSRFEKASFIAPIGPSKLLLLTLLLLIYFGLEARFKQGGFADRFARLTMLWRWFCYLIAILLILLMVNLNTKPDFIYFQF